MGYPSHIQAYYQELKHAGSFPLDSPNVLCAKVGSLSAGEVMQIQVQLNERQYIIDARFKVYGCGYAIAVCAYVCEQLLGKMLSEIAMNAQDLIVALRLPEQKYHCALLAEDALCTLVEKLNNAFETGVVSAE